MLWYSRSGEGDLEGARSMVETNVNLLPDWMLMPLLRTVLPVG